MPDVFLADDFSDNKGEYQSLQENILLKLLQEDTKYTDLVNNAIWHQKGDKVVIRFSFCKN